MGLAVGVNSASNVPAVGFYNQFLTTGSITVDTSKSYNNASASWNPLTYNLSYPSTFVTVSTVEIGLTLQSFTVDYNNNGPVHIYPKISAYKATGFQVKIYSSVASNFQKLTYMYVVVANYFRTFNNFRILMCEVPVNMNLSMIHTSPGYLCTVDPPLNSTTATFVGSFYGIDIIVHNIHYCIDVLIQDLIPISTTTINYTFSGAHNHYFTTVGIAYTLTIVYDPASAYSDNF